MNRNGYTLIEMLVVVSVVMMMSVLSFHMVPLHPTLQADVKNAMVLAIEHCRHIAITEQRPVILEFQKHAVKVDGVTHFEDENVQYVPQASFRFNEKGHITKGGTVEIKIHQAVVKLIFNVGYGAYRFEPS